MCTDCLCVGIYLRTEIYWTQGAYFHTVKKQWDQRGKINPGRAGAVRGEGQKQHKVQTLRVCGEIETGEENLEFLETFNVINAVKRQTPKNRKHRRCFPTKKVMQDNKENWRSVEMNLNKYRHTISRMPGKRHRKSLYCRHREQLWGDKKGNWYYWDCWNLLLPRCLFVCFNMSGQKEERKTERLQ